MRSLQTNKLLRRGNVVAMTAISLTTILGFVALTVDVGMIYNVQAELQRTADASSLAGASQLLDDSRLAGNFNANAVYAAVSAEAGAYSKLNEVYGDSPSVPANLGNAEGGDIVVGYLGNPDNLTQPFDFTDPELFNTVRVTVRRSGEQNGTIRTWFANVFGISEVTMAATSSATFKGNMQGIRVTGVTGKSNMVPLALHIDAWNGLLAGTWTTGDNYSFNDISGITGEGNDGINELNLYPGAGPAQLPPGNLGTVDIGSDSNATSDIARQILDGPSEADLAYHGGELVLGDDGTLILNGDTGLSASIKDELIAIKGRPIIIPLFNKVEGPGDNAIFTIVGFAGVRIMNVKMSGAIHKKEVIIQPSYVIDDSIITEPDDGTGTTTSWFVYEPLRLTR